MTFFTAPANGVSVIIVRAVVLKDGTGNLRLAADITLDGKDKTVTLFYDAAQSAWIEQSRGEV